MSESKKESISKQIEELSEGKVPKFSVVKQVTELLKSGLIANFSVSGVAPQFIATLHGKTSGFKSLLEFVQNYSKPKEKNDEDKAAGSSGSESD